MIVAAITEHSYNDKDTQHVIHAAMYTGALIGLLAGIGEERASDLIRHYRNMHQDQEYHICTAHAEDAEPEFDLHRLAHCKEPLRLIVGKRLVADDYIARLAAPAPDVIIAVGDFLSEIDDWERQLCMPFERSPFPDRVEIVTRVVGMLTDTCARSISFTPKQDNNPPMLIVVTVPDCPAMREVYKGTISF